VGEQNIVKIICVSKMIAEIVLK